MERKAGSLKGRSPGVQARASNVETINGNNVMEKNSTAKTNVIPFRKAELLLVEHNGQPYVPMKPVVEGMGLSWASQTVKLNGNKARWGVSMIETPSASGVQAYLCIPLKKLFGWMMTLHPSKVRKELREEILAFQNECDDVLWDYWNKGLAENKRFDALTPAQQCHVQQQVALIAKQPGNSFAAVYRSIKDEFKVGTYKDIPAERYGELCQFLGCEPIDGEWMPKPQAAALDDGLILNVGALITHARWTRKLFEQYRMYDALKALGSSAGVEMVDHVKGAAFVASMIEMQLKPEIERVRAETARVLGHSSMRATA